MPHRILSVSKTESLLKTRAMILQLHGYAVSSVDNARDAVRLCREEMFDAAILGHSMPVSEQQQITHAIRESCPGVLVLALRSCPTDEVSFADIVVDAHRPRELIDALERWFGGAAAAEKAS